MTIDADIVGIANGAFAECYVLSEIYYGAGEAEFAMIKVGKDNERLNNATIYFT